MNTTHGTMRFQTTDSKCSSTKDANTGVNADDRKTPLSNPLGDVTFVDIQPSNQNNSPINTPGTLRKEVKKDQQLSDLGLAVDEMLNK